MTRHVLIPGKYYHIYDKGICLGSVFYGEVPDLGYCFNRLAGGLYGNIEYIIFTPDEWVME